MRFLLLSLLMYSSVALRPPVAFTRRIHRVPTRLGKLAMGEYEEGAEGTVGDYMTKPCIAVRG